MRVAVYDTPLTTLATRLYLAVDCGGTKAAAAISDHHGHVIGCGTGGPANFTDVGLKRFLASVQEAICQALSQCHQLDPGTAGALDQGRLDATPIFEAAWFGIAGVDSEGDVLQLSPCLAALLALPYPSPRLLVANDTSLLAAPVQDPAYPSVRSGIVVIAGTGSIVMSFKQDESGSLQTVGRVGGFGWLLGDEGSGFWVGRDALRFVLDQADSERLEMLTDSTGATSSDRSLAQPAASNVHNPHLLRDMILDLWNLNSTDELLNAIYSNSPPDHPKIAHARDTQLDPTGSLQAISSASGRVLDSPRVSPSPYSSTGSTPLSSCDNSDDVLMAPSQIHKVDGLAVEETSGQAGSVTSEETSACEMADAAPSQAWASPAHAMQERKHRLASLSPLVFYLALERRDESSLSILRGQARRLAAQITCVLPRETRSLAYIDPSVSVLCMGGSLLGVDAYQGMLKDELVGMGVKFSRSIFVNDPAKSGSVALANMWEERMQQNA